MYVSVFVGRVLVGTTGLTDIAVPIIAKKMTTTTLVDKRRQAHQTIIEKGKREGSLSFQRTPRAVNLSFVLVDCRTEKVTQEAGLATI